MGTPSQFLIRKDRRVRLNYATLPDMQAWRSSARPPLLSMVAKVLPSDLVVRNRPQLSRQSDQRKVLSDREAPIVKQHMVVRAKAQQICNVVGPIMRTTKGADMRALRIRSANAFQADSACLAMVIVHFFDFAAFRGVPNKALNSCNEPLRRAVVGGRESGRGAFKRDELEPAHLKAGSAGFVPVTVNPIEAIVSIARGGAEFLVLPASKHSDRGSAQTARDQSGVAPRVERLVCRLGRAVAATTATMPGVNDDVAVVLVVRIAPRKNYRRRAGVAVAGDASVGLVVPAGVKNRATVFKNGASLGPRYFIDHQMPPGNVRMRIGRLLHSQNNVPAATALRCTFQQIGEA